MGKKYLFLFTLLASTLLLSGCFGGGGVIGIYKSQDNGTTWEPRVLVEDGDKPVTLAGTEVNEMKFGYNNDTQVASHKLYMATVNSGAYKSFDGASDWDSLNLGRNNVTSIAVSPVDENIIFAAIDRQILKTANAGTDWGVAYLSAGSSITTIVVDNFDPNRVYAGTSRGELLRSMDGGSNWTLLKKFEQDGPIREVLVNPNDTRNVYIFFQNNGVWKTSEAEKRNPEFVNLQPNITGQYNSERFGALNFQAAAIDASKADSVIYASRYGVIRTDDGGNTWQDINIVFSTQENPVLSIGINAQNGNGIYLGTINAIYKTDDGGSSWATLPPPSTLAPVEILVDPFGPNNVYMGLKRVKID